MLFWTKFKFTYIYILTINKILIKILLKYLTILSTIGILISCDKRETKTLEIHKSDSITWTEKTPCTVFFDGRELKGKIKYRGGISRKYAKHSYALELDTKFNFNYLDKDDDWILTSNYIDKTHIRHKLSYDLFNQMASRNVAAESIHVNLKVNNKSTGLYLLSEEINAGLLKLDKSDPMAMLFKGPPVFYKDRLKVVQDSNNYYQQKFPKKHKIDHSEYLDRFHEFLFHSNDSVFAKEIKKWIDIKSVRDWHIILLFTNNSDGLLKNFFLYKKNKKKPFRIAIWDYDHSFGRDGDNELSEHYDFIEPKKNILFKRLLENPYLDYKFKLQKRWFELKGKDVLTYENVEQIVNFNESLIQEDINNNAILWPYDGPFYYDDNTYEQEITLLKEFVKKNIPRLDQYFNTLTN